MFADKGEADRRVVEGSTQPVIGRVAHGTILRITQSLVIRSRGGVVFGRMARITGRAQRGVLAVGMALHTSSSGVLTGKWELGLAVIVGGA